MADRGYEVPWPEDSRLIAAAAVAAFNRRLAEHYRTYGRPNSAAEHDELAAAVEAAAMEVE
jgi:hypothetical protein